MHQYFQPSRKSNVDALIRFRAGETKLGQLISLPAEGSLQSFLEKTSAQFIVIGIAEDIGVLANGGTAGTASAWDSFLRSFLNIQANDFINADNIAVIGHFSFDALKEKIEKRTLDFEAKLHEYRKAVTIVDDAVTELIRLTVSCRKIPVVVGGGHNNAYPIIKGTALALARLENSKGINCVNLDAHIDYRSVEGRHSGNGFRYAKQEGFLLKYFALGIHENYIPGSILKEVNETTDIDFITYEDIFVRQRKTWMQALEEAEKFIGTNIGVGIELDLDSIEYLPSSAVTPCGITSREALQYIVQMSGNCRAAYLHICEGIASGDTALVGKLISYLVTNFMKGYQNKI